MNHLDRIPVSQVVQQLQKENCNEYLHLYLHTIFIKDPHLAVDYHALQVELYADYDAKYLLHFLRQSNSYPLERALAVCQARNYYREMVFILGRMGNNQQALQLIIDKIGDIREAIDFVSKQNDEELWEELINYSMRSSEFVSGLLDNIGAHVDPIKLINRIPSGMEIPGLAGRLVKIISDYNLQMSLREGCNSILKADCVALVGRLHRSQKTGIKVGDERGNSKCSICDGVIQYSKTNELIIVFLCSHLYHQRCIRLDAVNGNAKENEPDAANLNASEVPNPLAQRQYCPLCHQKGGPKGRKLGQKKQQQQLK